ncbi:MAG: hypothetical protein ACTHQ3_02560 [Motilibacteraceae bacterium]
MNRSPWSTAAAAAAVRDVLDGPGGISDQALLVDATAAPGGVLLTFRWRRDPTVYGYLIDDSGPRDRPSRPGVPTISETEWAQDLRWRLMESLETGGVRWAPRLTRSEPVILDLDRSPTERDRYYVDQVPTRPIAPGTHVIVIGGGPVPDFDPAFAGRWLDEAGLHVDRARSSLLAGRLLCWLQAYTNEARPTPVAHAAASWTEDRSAVVDTVEVLAGVEDGQALLSRLLWQLAYEATEQGATRLDVSAAPHQVVEPFRLPLEEGKPVLALPPPAELDPRYR